MSKKTSQNQTSNAAPAALSKGGLAALSVTNDASLWDSAEGETFGGNANILKLDAGQIAGPFVYAGVAEKALELDGEKHDVHEARDGANKLWRLPLAASFRKQIVESKLAEGDTFLVRRVEDAIKKKGKGRGNPMKIFQVKITARANPA